MGILKFKHLILYQLLTMKNVLLILIGLVILTNCSTRQVNKKQTVNQADRQDQPIEIKQSDKTFTLKFDSLKIETPLFFNDPVRNLKEFTINVNYPAFDKIINEMVNNKNVQETIVSGYCWGDCCGSYKVLVDTVSKSTLYLLKTDCYEYSFGNDQYLFVNDTLSMIRHFSCGVYDFRTDSVSPSFKMEEKLFLFNRDNVTIKERNKTIRGDKNYTFNGTEFKDTIGDRTELLKKETKEFTERIDFIKKVAEEERLRTEQERIKNDKQNEIINNLTREQLSSIGESRRQIFEKLLAAGAMKEKRFYMMAGSRNSITAYYQYKRIVLVIYKTINSSDEVTATDAYYFDESNNCIYNMKWNIEDKITYTYDMHWGSLIKYDVNYKRMEIEPTQKQQIIQSARASLSTMMQHFPGFKYSFNWK